MDADGWRTEAEALAAAHAIRVTDEDLEENARLDLACPTPSQLRLALVELHQLLSAAPTSIAQAYKRITEQKLRAKTILAQANLTSGSLAWIGGDPVFAAAAQARALDLHLLAYDDTRGRPSDPSAAYLCRELGVHVVPRPRAVVPDAENVGTPTYRRRGLVWHRIVPAKIGDFRIELHWYRDLSLSFRATDPQVVGAVFEGLDLTPDRRFRHFVARAAPCLDETRDLAAQVDAVYAGGVVLAVWPELTMPQERRDRLADMLLQRSKSAEPGTGACIVAAGSWHEVDGGKVRNRMRILSGLGQERMHHDKSIPLASSSLGTEELTPAYVIPVLITEDTLLAFAICRDFCEAQIADVYVQLDVDLIVVPSYGDASTIRAHRHQAGNLSLDPGTRTFVVQQVVRDEVAASADGYILPPNADPTKIQDDDMFAAPAVHAHPISFKRV